MGGPRRPSDCTSVDVATQADVLPAVQGPVSQRFVRATNSLHL